jgi:hypothetical protein
MGSPSFQRARSVGGKRVQQREARARATGRRPRWWLSLQWWNGVLAMRECWPWRDSKDRQIGGTEFPVAPRRDIYTPFTCPRASAAQRIRAAACRRGPVAPHRCPVTCRQPRMLEPPDDEVVDVFVGGLPPEVQEQQVQRAFAEAAGGALLAVELARWGGPGGLCKGFGHLRFRGLLAAQAACAAVKEVRRLAGWLAGCGGPARGSPAPSPRTAPPWRSGRRARVQPPPLRPPPLRPQPPVAPLPRRWPATRWTRTWPRGSSSSCARPTPRQKRPLQQAASPAWRASWRGWPPRRRRRRRRTHRAQPAW